MFRMNDSMKPDLFVVSSGDHVTAFRVNGTDVRYLVRIPVIVPPQCALAPSVLARLTQTGDFARVLLAREPDAPDALGERRLASGVEIVRLPSVKTLSAALKLDAQFASDDESGWQPIPEHLPQPSL